MTTVLLLLALLAAPGPAARADERPLPPDVADLAGDVPAGVLRFAIVAAEPGGAEADAGDAARAADDGSHAPADVETIPGRLTFVPDDLSVPVLFPNTGARPHDLAVRRNCVTSLSGRGAITVPAGRYTVWASRGLEWSADATRLEIEPGATHVWTARLAHEVDTTGWISADFHLHTLTHSGHGDASLPERVITLVGEGVELAVATDHNHHTDYGPTVEQLGAGARLTHVTGNEVTTPLGHLNAFPLEPDRPVPDPHARDANPLFAAIRAEPNRYGVVPIIQLNHPRWDGMDVFTQLGLDPVTGTSDSPRWSDDFDTVEVMNENAGWGFFDADVAPPGLPVGSGIHSVLGDWFNLLERGHRSFAVGNSDSHTVHYAFAGYPRNFVASSTDDPGAIDPAEIVGNIRRGRLFTTLGPFVELTVDGAPMGSEIAPSGPGGTVHVEARVQSASWIEVDRLRIVVNGDPVRVPPGSSATRHDGPGRLRELSWELPLARDAWIALVVEGDTPLDPVVGGGPRPVWPLAVTNPVWVDVDGGGFTPTSDWARARARGGDDVGALARTALSAGRSSEAALLVLAAARERIAAAPDVLRWALSVDAREVRLAAARGGERLGAESLRPHLLAALRAAGDVYERLALLAALRACGDEEHEQRALALLHTEPRETLARYDHALLPLLPGGAVRDWLAIGFFPNPERGAIATTSHGPERDPAPDAVHAGVGGAPLRWQPLTAGDDGFLDLARLGDNAEHAIAYAQTWLRVERDTTVPFLLGSDDGCLAWLNGEPVHHDVSRHGASPLQHLGELPLRAGWNRLLCKVENGTGAFGLYLRLLQSDVECSARPGP